MESLPHTYEVKFEQQDNLLVTNSEAAPSILAGAPPQFGGSSDNWSPETLFLASIGQCLFLTFVSIARASKLEFSNYQSTVQGLLEKTDHGLAFTSADIEVSLWSKNDDLAARLIQKAKRACLVTNSLNFKCDLTFHTDSKPAPDSDLGTALLHHFDNQP